MATLWALLVGIDQYRQYPLHGAVKDVNAIDQYLRADRGVRSECIVVLRDEEAQRGTIIDTFRRHLIDNPNIRHGDPILFYYAGHGDRRPLPSSLVQEQFDVEDPQQDSVESIVPYDAVFFKDRDANPSAEAPIPDYTLGALVRRAARAHGNNITIVFDCCHSGHGTRGAQEQGTHLYRSRKIDSELVGELTPDTDREIWAEETRGVTCGYTPYRDGWRDREDTHVLMAACERHEFAVDSGQGGLFTKYWLETLRDNDARSYTEIKDHINQKLQAFYREPYILALPQEKRPDVQHPVVEGVSRDRHIFENATCQDRQRFAVQKVNERDCIIFAGEIAGVKPGTVFQLQRMDHSSDDEQDLNIIGSAVVTGVLVSRCVAKLGNGVVLPAEFVVRAILTHPLRCFILNDESNNAGAVEVESNLRKALTSPDPAFDPWFRLVGTSEEAQLVLEAHQDHVSLIRTDQVFGNYHQPHSEIKAKDISNALPSILRNVARFNYYLGLSKEDGSLTADVDITLHHLDDSKRTDDDDYAQIGNQVPIESGKATLPHGEDEIYGLVLHNRGSDALHAYVLAFDPTTCEIMLFYTPKGSEPALKPAASLKVGRSSECSEALFFTAGDSQHPETVFLRVILTTKPMDLRFMEQPACLGYDLYGRLNYYATRGNDKHEGEKGVPHGVEGSWDLKSIQVTVVRAED